MKYFILILMLISGICYGQNTNPFDSSLKIMQGLGLTPLTTQDTMRLLYDSGWARAQPIYHRKQDTVAILALCGDTAFKKGVFNFKIFYNSKDSSATVGETSNHVPYVFWQYGYSIKELHNTGEYSIDPGSCSGCYHDYYQHIQYLDKNKQKLSPNIVVWQSIEVK